jgi:hypothetical protein
MVSQLCRKAERVKYRKIVLVTKLILVQRCIPEEWFRLINPECLDKWHDWYVVARGYTGAAATIIIRLHAGGLQNREVATGLQ